MGLIRIAADIFELIYDEAMNEWLDETKYMEALDESYSELESGNITEEEYEERETAILEQLKTVRNYKKEHNL